jgi:DNA-nicking Smr family endonuclease
MRELQLAHFERMLQRAIEQRARRIVFIHGVGQGVLKHEIWSRVEQFYPQCTCRYADPRRYGAGATEVEISGQGWAR